MRKKQKKLKKPRLAVSVVYHPGNEYPECAFCSASIAPEWGDYLYQYYTLKDRSDSVFICKSCAIKLENEHPEVKVVSASHLNEYIKMQTAYFSRPEQFPTSATDDAAYAAIEQKMAAEKAAREKETNADSDRSNGPSDSVPGDTDNTDREP
ncbi:MAG: hypothetical protein K9L68_07855 [Spirochaetales bacterium]|nr:hypothetical protein [Spirochaetales bacterium]MCF7938496.1 hypothetical protein [Spirochaetales bacterium]